MLLRGIGAAPGQAVGPAWRHRQAAGATPVPDIRAAADTAANELYELADRVRASGRTDDAGIFEAQALMCVDPLLIGEAEARAAAARAATPDEIAAALDAAARAAADMLAQLGDELLAARAADVRDAGSRICRIITGRRLVLPDRPSVAVAEDLPPSVTAEIPDGMLLGIVLEGGSATSHAAILARGLGIPAVVGVPGLLAALGPADRSDPPILAIDGSGDVIVEPTAADLARLDRRREAETALADRAKVLRGTPGRTADGHPVMLVANIGRPEDSTRALESGAEGVGLFRTEFVFVGRNDMPSEDEQTEAYAAVLRAFGAGRPVVIRLADIGGDKPIPYLHLPAEENPFLGVRGLRLAVDDPELYLRQLRAVARAGAIAGVVPHVMAPMVTTIEDVRLVHSLVAEALAQLDAAGVPRIERLEVGIMVEVPAAALTAAELGREVDFFSIGSNDLTQYTLAMDRTNPRLAATADALHPAVLRAIALTVQGAAATGTPVGVCGELAGDPLGALVLAGIGVAELSMDAGSLDAVRWALAGVTFAELEALASRALAASSAHEVRALAAAVLEPAVARA